jgi:hypothetical protein
MLLKAVSVQDFEDLEFGNDEERISGRRETMDRKYS